MKQFIRFQVFSLITLAAFEAGYQIEALYGTRWALAFAAIICGAVFTYAMELYEDGLPKKQ